MSGPKRKPCLNNNCGKPSIPWSAFCENCGSTSHFTPGERADQEAFIQASRNTAVANADLPEPNDMQRTIAFFKSLGVRNIEVVQHEHFQGLKFGHSNYSDDEIIDIGDGYPGFFIGFKFSLTSGNLMTMGVWE